MSPSTSALLSMLCDVIPNCSREDAHHVELAQTHIIRLAIENDRLTQELDDISQLMDELRSRIDCLTFVAEDGVKAMRQLGRDNGDNLEGVAVLEGVIARCRNAPTRETR